MRGWGEPENKKEERGGEHVCTLYFDGMVVVANGGHLAVGRRGGSL